MSKNFSVRQIIDAKCLALLVSKPFLGFIVKRMNIIEDKGSYIGEIGTAATDGKNIFYNEQFFSTLAPQEVVFVIAHEIMHCVLDTIGRTESRDKQYWNMATDYVNNGMLVADNIGALPKYNVDNIEFYKKQYIDAGQPVPPELAIGNVLGLYDNKYAGWTAEEVYADLLKNKVPKKQTMDVHLQAKGSSGGDDEKEGKNGGNSKTDVLSQKQLDDNAKEFKKIIIESIQRVKAAGHQLGSLEMMVCDLLTPKINWRTLLHESIQSMFKDDITWTRPNRRSVSPQMILPSSKYQDTVELCVSIDTSGSISDEQRIEFLSEIGGILNFYKNFKLKLWCFDTGIHCVADFDDTNINDLPGYKPGGGGGTDIACNFHWMKENDIHPQQMVIFTDGYNGSDNWGDPNWCKTTWLIHSNSKCVPPFGRFAIYEDITDR